MIDVLYGFCQAGGPQAGYFLLKFMTDLIIYAKSLFLLILKQFIFQSLSSNSELYPDSSSLTTPKSSSSSLKTPESFGLTSETSSLITLVVQADNS